MNRSESSFGIRLKAALKGRSNRWLADLFDISEGTIRNYLRGATLPDAEVVIEFARELGVHPNWLLTGEGEMSPAAVTYQVKTNRPVQSGPIEGSDLDLDVFALVPFYDVAVAAGHGRTVNDQAAKPSAQNAYRREWLHKRGLVAAQLFEVVVVGDSMQDELRDGDTVLVDRGQREPRGGSIYVLRQGDNLLVKYLQLLPGGAVQVSSENSRAFPPYSIDPVRFESGEVEIIGRVVRQGRDR